MTLTFREALQKDLHLLDQKLADAQLGAMRKGASLPLDSGYFNAFNSINDSINNKLIVVEYDNKIIGML